MGADRIAPDSNYVYCLDVFANDALGAGYSLVSLVIKSQPAHGSVKQCTSRGKEWLAIETDPGYVGSQSFTYAVRETNGESTVESLPATVSITSVQNKPPVGNPDTKTATSGVALDIEVLRENDTDPDACAECTLLGFQPPDLLIVRQPNHGTASKLKLDNNADKVRYQSNAGYTGPDSFDYVPIDWLGVRGNVTTVTLTVVGPPIANDDVASTRSGPTAGEQVDINVLANDSDPGGSALTVTVPPEQSYNGTVTVAPAGVIRYTPNPGFTGLATITYVATNTSNLSDSAVVSVTVESDEVPVAADDSYQVPANSGGPLAVLANDSDLDDVLAYRDLVVVSNVANGILTHGCEGACPPPQYTPNPGFKGVDSFTYKVFDSLGAESNVATVTITVANALPTIVTPAAQFGTVGTAASLQIQASDPDGDPLSYSAAGLPPGLEINVESGLISGTPTAKGSFNVVVSVNDGLETGNASTQAFAWTIDLPNEPPAITNPGNQKSKVGTAVTLQIQASDPNEDPLSYSAEGLPPGLSIGAESGLISGTPTETGIYDNVTVWVSDNREEGAPSVSFSWTIDTANFPPSVTNPGAQTGVVGEAARLQIVASDPDNEPLNYDAQGLPAGLEIDAATGLITGIPTAAGTSENVVIRVSDASGATRSVLFSWTIDARANSVPTAAIAGGNRTIADTNSAPGEAVAFDGSGSSDPDGSITAYEWSVDGKVVDVGGATPTINLPDGSSTVSLVVTDNLGAKSAPATVTITIRANSAPTAAIAGGNRTIADTNNAPGEAVAFDGSGSSDPDGSITAYAWSVNGQAVAGASGATPTINLPDGSSTVSLVVTDNLGAKSAPATVTITTRANSAPTAAIAGGNRTVADTDGAAGEPVAVDGSGSSDPDGSVSAYRWSVNGQVIADASTARPTFRLADGANTVSLVVTDNVGATSQPASVTITVQSSNKLPIPAIDGGDREVPDGNDQPGEVVEFTGSATDADGTVDTASFRWSVNGQAVASQNGKATALLPLNQGENTVTLSVTDDKGGVGTTSVKVTVGPPNQISDLPDLSDNQQAAAEATETVCSNLLTQDAASLTPEEQNLRNTCDTIFANAGDTAAVTEAMQEISGEQISAQQTTAIDFSMAQLLNVGARLRALRQGAKGFSVAGLGLDMGNSALPLATLAQFGEFLAGEGGSGGDEDGDLLGDRLGIFINGSIRWGDKDPTDNESGFEFDSNGLTIGADYRFSDAFVAGLALGYARADADFDNSGGTQDSDGMSGSLYGSWYTERSYVDGVFTYGGVSYDSVRNIDIASMGITDVAKSETDGSQWALGASAGWDFGKGALRIGPTVAVNYTKVDIDGFQEKTTGTSGLAMVFGDQSADSLTMRLGGQFSYSFSRKWGVISPHARVDFVREFKNDSENISVRFANDSFVPSPGQPGGSFVIFTDNPDENYFIWGAGFSAQFLKGLSGFVDYESVSGLDDITSSEVSLGLRYESRFR